MHMTIIVPAFNEEAYIAPTLDALRASADHLSARSDADVEIIVVDNDSEDETASVARNRGAKGSVSRCGTLREPATRGRAMPQGRFSSSSMRTCSCRACCSTRSTWR